MKILKKLFIIVVSLVSIAACVQDGTGTDIDKIEMLTKESSKKVISTLLPKASEITTLVYDGIKIDEKEYIEYGEDKRKFYFVTDERFKSRLDVEKHIREVFSDREFSKNFAGAIYGNQALFIEKDGKLYLSKLEGSAPKTLNWNIDSSEFGQQAGNRAVAYLDIMLTDGVEPGKIVLVKEDGKWKFDINPSFHTGTPYPSFYESDENGSHIIDRQGVIDYILDENNGANIEKGDYVFEVDSVERMIKNDDQKYSYYYMVDLYKDNVKKYRLAVPVTKDNPIIHIESDSKGDIRYDYSKSVKTKGSDDLYFFTAQKVSDVESYASKFEKDYIYEGSIAGGIGGGSYMVCISPKYYGTMIEFINEKGEIIAVVEDGSIFFSDAFKGKVVIRNGDQKVELVPTSDLSTNLERGTRLNLDYKES